MMLAQQLYEGIELPGLGVDGPVGLITYMRTDSVRVSDEALTAVREHVATAFGADYLPEKPNFYKSKADAQDAHEAIRPTSLAVRSRNRAPVPHAGPVLALPADLESLRRLADDAGDVRRDDRRRDGRRLHLPRQGHGAEVRRLDGDLRPDAAASRPSPQTSRTKTRHVRRAAAARGRRPARAEGPASRTEVHAAAAALHRSDARQGARGERHRPAEHLRLDHRRAAGSRLRQQARGPLQADARSASSSATCSSKSFEDIIDVEYTRSLEDDLDKIEQGKTDYVRHAGRVLQEVQERPGQGRQGDAEPQGGDQDRRGLRPLRLADADQGRQVRSVHRLQRAIRSAPTRASSRRTSPSPRAARRKSSPARTAASRWS